MSRRTGEVWSGRPRAVTWAVWAVIGAAGVLLGGCDLIKAATYFATPDTEKVAPEFSRLEGKQVLIYVWAEPEILWDYSKIRLDLSGYLGAYLPKHVKNVKVVDVAQVERYVEQQRTTEQDPAQVGRHFKADTVIHLSVYHFSLRDPEMAHFFRGRLSSSVHVYDLTKPDEPERIALQDAKVVVPENGPIGIENATADLVRQQTYDAFTVEVGKKFHEWERPRDR